MGAQTPMKYKLILTLQIFHGTGASTSVTAIDFNDFWHAKDAGEKWANENKGTYIVVEDSV